MKENKYFMIQILCLFMFAIAFFMSYSSDFRWMFLTPIFYVMAMYFGHKDSILKLAYKNSQIIKYQTLQNLSYAIAMMVIYLYLLKVSFSVHRKVIVTVPIFYYAVAYILFLCPTFYFYIMKNKEIRKMTK